jgi:hypothetical protein
MSCVNINHPSYKALVEETNINETILKAKIGVWFNENGENRFPAAEEIGLESKTKENTFYSLSSVSEDAVNWLQDNLPQYYVNKYGIIDTLGRELKDSEKESINNYLAVKNARYRSSFRLYRTKTGKYGISNLALQINSTNAEPSNAKINASLQKFITKLGINVETINNMKERMGIDAVAAADILHKVILIADGRADITTLPEEVAHFFVELLPEGHPLLVSMMQEIKGNPIYAEVVEQYSEVYEGNEDKLKKEAIGKLIAQEIIKKGNTDTNVRVVRWWNKVWDYIKAIFTGNINSKLEFIEETAPDLYNPFSKAAADIISGDTRGLKKSGKGIFFELANQKAKSDAYDNLRSRITRFTTTNSKNQTVEDYRIDGVNREDAGYERVTTEIRSRYNNANRENALNIDEKYASQGTLVHSMIENIISNVYKTQLGETPIDFVFTTNTEQLKREKLAYNTLKLAFTPFALELYQKGALIKIEQPIINSTLKLVGTIDLLVINENGTEEIYDFKTRGTDKVSFSKREEYNAQLLLYKKMVNMGDVSFNIPPGNVAKAHIFGMRIKRNVNLDIKGIAVDDYNLPVSDELTGIEPLDNKIEVLRYRLKNLEFKFKSLYNSVEKINLASKIEELQKTIDLAITEKSFEPIIEYGNNEVLVIKHLLDKDTISYDTLQNAYYDMLLYQNIDLVDVNDIIIRKGLIDLASRAKTVNFAVMGTIKEKIIADAANRNLMGNKDESNFLKLSVPQSKINAWIRGGSFTKDDFVKVVNDLVVVAKERARIKFESYSEKLQTKITNFLANESNFDSLINNETGDLYPKFSASLFADKQKAKEEKNMQWFKDNYDVTEETKQKYQNMVDMQKEVIKTLSPEALKRKYKFIANIYDGLAMSQEDALLDYWKTEHPIEMYGKLKNEQRYYSDAFKSIAANPHQLEFYNFWLESMEEFREITGREFKLNMLPNIQADTMDRLLKNGLSAAKGIFSFDWLNIDRQEIETTFDPLTKEKLYRVPLPFVSQDYTHLIEKYIAKGLTKEEAEKAAKKEFIDNKSKDVGTSMLLFANAAFNNRAMQEIEQEAVALRLLTKNLSVEDIDKSLSNKQKEDIAKNMHLTQEQVTDIIETYIYGKKDNSTEDEQQLRQTLDKVGKFTALSRLALNFFSPVVNLLGGAANSYMMAAKRMGFNTDDLNTGYSRHIKINDKTKAFYSLFPVLMEEFMPENLGKFSVNKAKKYLTTDKAFVFQRIGDKTVQFGVLNAMLESHTVVDGKIVNKIKHLKEKYNYSNLTGEERSEVLKKVEQEAKDLKSVYELAEVKDGKIDIEKLGLSEDSIISFKRKVTKTNKYIIGNTDPNDLAMIKRNMWGRQVMVFRSWIQALGDERFMDSYYDNDLEQTVEGRYRTLFNIYKKLGLKAAVQIQLGLIKAKNTNLTDTEIANIRANARELQIILIGVLAFAATHIGDDKDKPGIVKYTMRITSRLIDELTFFINPAAAFNIVSSPVASSSVIKDVFSVLDETLDLAYYGVFGTEEEYEDKVKLRRAIVRSTPIVGQGLRLAETITE